MYLQNAGPKEVFRLINDSNQFPFFFVIQAIWCCYVMKKSYNQSKKTDQSAQKNFAKLNFCFLVALVMTFSSRELVAVITKRNASPIRSKPLQIPIFVLIFALMNFIPFDIIFKIVDVMYYFLGLLQGFNQMRLFLRVIEYSKKGNLYQTNFQSYFIATGAIIFEYVIECSMRRIIRTSPTKVSNGRAIIRTVLICLIYVCALNAELIAPYITKNHLADVLFGAALGISNAAIIL